MIEIKKILDVEKYIDDVDAVIFDLDDTLYSEKNYVRSGFKSIAEHYMIPGIELELWDAFSSGKKPIDDVFNARNILDKKEEAINIYRNHKPNIVLYPGVKEMLVNINNLHKKTGIITDGRPEGQRAKISALNIEKYFDYIIITDELGGASFRKPNTDAFILMQREMGITFERMVYVGDNIQKDFVAPEKLGMKQIHFKNLDGIYV